MEKARTAVRLTQKLLPLAGLLLAGLLLAGAVVAVHAGRASATHTFQVGIASAHASTAAAPDDLALLYVFSGVTDDGEQGSADRREATSIHCTNIDDSASTQVWVEVYQWNGTDFYTGTVNVPPGRTFTFSTQNTTIYFDDVILGGSPGTGAIFQGHGRIYAEHARVACTAQVLDPLGYPPEYVSRLAMSYPDGTPVGEPFEIYLPAVPSDIP